MRKTRKTNAKKERVIMIASSAFVLTALTLTGIYMKSSKMQEQDDGYTIDFRALEDSVQNKIHEIESAKENYGFQSEGQYMEDGILSEIAMQEPEVDGDLDYVPMEVGSGLVTIPGRGDALETEGVQKPAESKTNAGAAVAQTQKPAEKAGATADQTADSAAVNAKAAGANEAVNPAPQLEEESAVDSGTAARTLHFAEGDGLLRPVGGEVLIPFSMDSSVYFYTLEHYKRNSAMVIAAEKGAEVVACADGKVVEVFQNEEIGHAVTMEIGDGYKITYGQLENINVGLNSYVEQGQTIASVAAPTKYYSVEGSNLYLRLTADGKPVNPEQLFQ